MDKTKTIFLAAILALASSVAVAQSAIQISAPKGTRTLAQSVAEDGEVAMYCKYIGTSACASIAIDAGTGDLTFTDGTCGAESATDTFECPVAAPLGGVIDVSNAACNTMGELVDIVNTSSDWRCQLYASLRADTSTDTLVTIAATQATDPDGLGLNVDSSVALTSTVVLEPLAAEGGQPRGYRRLSLGPQSTAFLVKPYASPARQAFLTSAIATSTYGVGTSVLSVIAVDRTFGATGSETSYTIWPATAAGATTVAKEFGGCDTPATACDVAWGQGGLLCPAGMQCLVRLTNSNALASNTIGVNGFYWNLPPGGLGGPQ